MIIFLKNWGGLHMITGRKLTKNYVNLFKEKPANAVISLAKILDNFFSFSLLNKPQRNGTSFIFDYYKNHNVRILQHHIEQYFLRQLMVMYKKKDAIIFNELDLSTYLLCHLIIHKTRKVQRAAVSFYKELFFAK